MTASITPAMDEMFAALRSFLLDLLPSLTECRQAQMNRTAMPKGDFAVMTPIHSQGCQRHAFVISSTARRVRKLIAGLQNGVAR
jgi:hypothetical protein